MLSRLEDLQKAIKPQEDEGEGEEETSFLASLKQALLNRGNEDETKKINHFQEMVEAEDVTGAKVREFTKTLAKMRDTRACERQAVLPEKIQQLSSKLDSEESSCMRLLNSTKTLLEDLRNQPKPTEPPEKKAQREKLEFQTYQRIRENYAQWYKSDFDILVQDFFSLRSQLRQEIVAFIRRRLRFAYPDANEDILQEVLLFPQLAKMAIDRRMDVGEDEEVPSLEDVFEELAESDFSQEIKLTTETGELKMLFIQFAEIIAAQGEALSAVEANIQKTLKHTQDAIGSLESAVNFKREAQRLAAMRKLGMRMLGVAAVFLVLKSMGAPVEDGIAAVWYVLTFAFRSAESEYEQIEHGGHGHGSALQKSLQQEYRTQAWNGSQLILQHQPHLAAQPSHQLEQRPFATAFRRSRVRKRRPSATVLPALPRVTTSALRGTVVGGAFGKSLDAGADSVPSGQMATGGGRLFRSSLPRSVKAVAVALTSRGAAVAGHPVASASRAGG
eukprot:TRINITY_DN49580_c0_g1_i1.p1 TRINITY_DN49580_c0_g1~~TRINITY_DN49580_c0_g1_i1.p1  ORF type:complete len:502 (-),score=93.92 TRINITY_DN49580_c0_g1_i1:102-1607(-)